MQVLPDILRTRLSEPLPGRTAQDKMMGRLRPMPEVIPENIRDSAVLQLIYPINNEPTLLFIRRSDDGRTHGGQISFPGGRHEEADTDFQITALRETQEEVGIIPSNIELIGALTPLYIPVSFYMVHPFVAWSETRPEFHPNIEEVSEIIEVPVASLFHKENKIITHVTSTAMPGQTFTVPAYNLPDGSFIWGATAMMLSELEELIMRP